ncbi:AAA family ATPase [Corynebacterium aurimucosum]|nr:AAA family ATPase [Corynebacterium aurimucosum]
MSHIETIVGNATTSHRPRHPYRKQLESILRRWREKKNLILQGPPGTGKTWLGRKLAYAMLEDSSDEAITAVQFHPSTSYEDFIEGFRPASDGHLRLQPGPFLKAVRAATDDEGRKHFIIIEEINRGNPAQIFGEMLTLLEADKRNSESALTTIYSPDSEPIYLPENLYVIGTMNQADRSLAIVDMALRRRFAFVDLQPQFNERWLDFCSAECGYDRETLATIGMKLAALNDRIANDVNLGRDYGVGHSFVTPRKSSKPLSGDETRKWFVAIIDPTNEASIALALKLGLRHVPGAGVPDDYEVYRLG